jgi:hypothetical protein
VDREVEKSFGFVADPTKSKCYNASIYLAIVPTWSYFSRPSNMAFHDLTTRIKPPKNTRSLLGLGLKFIPNPKYNVPLTNYAAESLPCFDRDLKVKSFMAGLPGDDNFNPKLYARSK